MLTEEKNKIAESCDINAKDQSCSCSSESEIVKNDLSVHWDNTYLASTEEKLGWFETDLSPTLKLIEMCGIKHDATILNVGAGNTRLVDELINLGYSNIIATDISQAGLDQLNNRIGEGARYIKDDLTNPTILLNEPQVGLWIDRAVLHFFTEKEQQAVYLHLLNQLIEPGGYVLLAQFAEDGADMCSGLPIYRYSVNMMKEYLGSSYELLESFQYEYTMPNGELRKYNYALFRKVKTS